MLPMTVEEVLKIDNEIGTEFRHKAIEKETKNVQLASKILEEGEHEPIGYQKICCHIIFDENFDFTRKVRFVAGGHLTQPQSSMTYSSVVSRESVIRIGCMKKSPEQPGNLNS